jgi:hypothetical protein
MIYFQFISSYDEDFVNKLDSIYMTLLFYFCFRGALKFILLTFFTWSVGGFIYLDVGDYEEILLVVKFQSITLSSIVFPTRVVY